MPRTPLFDAEGYFAEHDGALAQALGVFGAYLVAMIASTYAIVQLLFDQVENAPAGLERALQSVMGGVVVGMVIGGVLGLLIVAGIIHLLSGGSSTGGTYGDALAVAGWAYAPELVTMPINYLLASRAVQEYSFDATDPERLDAQIQAAEADLQTNGGTFLLLLLVTAWSVVILARGVSATHDVPLETAAVPALIVGIGSVLLVLV